MEVCFYFRVLCFRFYFVGDEDLLEIIGNSKNVPRLQKHFKKMFAGVHSVILSDDQTKVLGISAKEGEQVILHISSLPPSPPSSPSPLPPLSLSPSFLSSSSFLSPSFLSSLSLPSPSPSSCFLSLSFSCPAVFSCTVLVGANHMRYTL